MVKAFLTHPVTWIQRTSLFSLHLEECVCVCVVECTMQWTNNCSVIFFFSFLVTKCLGFDVTEWFNLMPNDWTITLYSLTSTWAVFYKQKQNASSFPFSRLAVLQHFNLSFKPSWLLCLFPDFNFTWMRKHYSKRTFHLKGLKIFQLLDCWRQQRSWRNVMLTRREGFLWFSRSANACTDPNWWCRELILTLKKKFSCFPIGQSALCKYGRYIFTDQLYLAVCTMIVATVWTVYSGFCILDLPKHHLLYVSDSFSLFFFWSWYWRAVRFLRSPAPEGSKLQISVLSGHCHSNLQDTTLCWL